MDTSNINKDIPWVHVLRALACALVVALHTIPPASNFTFTGFDATYRHIMMVLTKPCVPLFFMLTGYLILPPKELSAFSFYQKRIPRVLYPLLFWGIIYAILPWVLNMCNLKQMFTELLLSPIKSPYIIGGILWYLYILIGVYLIIPYVHPSVYSENKTLSIYLLVWLITSFIIIVYRVNPVAMDNVLGKNSYEHYFDMTIYFSGYLGYLFLGYSIRNKKYIYNCLNIGGGRILMLIILMVVAIASVIVPLTCSFLSIGTVIMSFCLFSMFSEMRLLEGRLLKIIKGISKYSFGIYLCHMAIFNVISTQIYNKYGPHWFLHIIVFAITIVLSYFLVHMISRFKYKRYIVG